FEQNVQQRGEKVEDNWYKLIKEYKHTYPELAKEFEQTISNKLPNNWNNNLPMFESGKDDQATRKASSAMINAISKTVPNLFGGSADLASSNNTMMTDDKDLRKKIMQGAIFGLEFVNFLCLLF